MKFLVYVLMLLFVFPVYSQTISGPVPKGLNLKGNDEPFKRWAIVIGVNDYNDVGITDLSKARNDAKIVAQILTEQGGFEKIFLMTDDLNAKDPLYPTRVNIELKVDNVLEFASSEDLIIFYFSGHGVSDPEGRGYILPVDTAMDKAYYTSVKVDDIIRRFNDKGLKKTLLMLDACRDVLASSKSSNKQGLQSNHFDNAEVAATFFSTRAGDFSFEDPKSDFGIFTKYLAYGLEGKADANNDGLITFAELESYVQQKVTEWSQANNKKQVPYVKYHREKFGDFPITVHGKREKSLVEENEFGKTDSRLPHAWRSALLPGWGQWYDGGKEKARSFFGIWGLLGVITYQRYTTHQKNEESYTSAIGLPALAGQGDMLAANYFLVNPKRKAFLESQNSLNQGLLFMGLFWTLNMFDIFYFKKNEYFWSFQFDYIPANNQNLHALGNSRLNGDVLWKFEFRF